MTATTTRDLLALGHQPHDIARLVSSGELHRVRRGAYANHHAPNAEEQHVLLIQGTLPRLRPDSVISHSSAAVLHGLPVPADLLSTVTATRPRKGSGGGNVTGIVHTFAGCLDADDVVLIDGIPTTTLARTAADMARVLSRRDAVVLLDAALHAPGGGELAGLRHLIAEQLRLDRSRRRHAGRALIWLDLADGLAESPLESISRLGFVDHGVPKPVLQYVLRDAHGRFVARFDFAWPWKRIAGEADGRAKYDQLLRPGDTAVDAVMREKGPENLVLGEGWGLLRWGMPEALAPAILARRVKSVLASRPSEL